MSVREQIEELTGGEGVMYADGYDDAILGVVERRGTQIVVYSEDKVIANLEEQGMSPESAREFFDFNIAAAWLGEQTPLFLRERDDGSADARADYTKADALLTEAGFRAGDVTARVGRMLALINKLREDVHNAHLRTDELMEQRTRADDRLGKLHAIIGFQTGMTTEQVFALIDDHAKLKALVTDALTAMQTDGYLELSDFGDRFLSATEHLE